ncbi:hypothetical protein SLY_0560 [Strawberry lethal yellows phytoplasma (CPA) str. NZSb11]|uniref:Uncharacterized protein n=1 Tax=Strawberry lethal yellows phytoplasma (CPA) str. NZSb11 TaxID=980422 RepID=R4RX75_PHYAS|nr:hypothetical protein SLY_0560 [Strawberry lethal yellows phytoplasma (CPA) str. NZSb11]
MVSSTKMAPFENNIFFQKKYDFFEKPNCLLTTYIIT